MMLPKMAHSHDTDAQPVHHLFSPALSGPAVLALLLDLDEVQQAANFRAEMTMRFEDLGGLLSGHPGAVKQPVRSCSDVIA